MKLSGGAKRDDHDQRTPAVYPEPVVNEPLTALVTKRNELFREMLALESKVAGINRAIELLKLNQQAHRGRKGG